MTPQQRKDITDMMQNNGLGYGSFEALSYYESCIETIAKYAERREREVAWEAWKHLTPDIYYKMPHSDRIREEFDRWYKSRSGGKEKTE